MPVWGRGVLTLPVSKKCKNEKKERKKKKKKKETKNANSIDTMFNRNFHFVSRTEGENYSWFALTRLCLAGGVPVAAAKDRERSGEDTPSERIKPRRRGARHLSVLPKAFNIDFTWGLPLSFPMFLEAQVRRATVTSSRRRAGAQQVWKKKYQGPANRFQA